MFYFLHDSHFFQVVSSLHFLDFVAHVHLLDGVDFVVSDVYRLVHYAFRASAHYLQHFEIRKLVLLVADRFVSHGSFRGEVPVLRVVHFLSW